MMLAEEERFVAILKEKGFNVIVKRPPQFFEEDECLDMVGNIDGWLAGDDVITAAVIDKALPRLKVISKWGTGLDSIDLDAARACDLPVLNTPAAFQDAVAEVALSYMIELARNIVRTDRHIREGQWPKTPSLGLMGQSLASLALGRSDRVSPNGRRPLMADINFMTLISRVTPNHHCSVTTVLTICCKHRALSVCVQYVARKLPFNE